MNVTSENMREKFDALADQLVTPPNATYPDGVTYKMLWSFAKKSRSTNERLIAAAKAGIPVGLSGPPGYGKTAMVLHFAKAMDARVIWISPSSSPDKFVLPGLGRREVDGDVYTYLDHLPIAELEDDGRPTVVIIDDAARHQPAVKQQHLQLMDPTPHIGPVEIPNVLLRVMTFNRVADGMDPLDPAIATRIITTDVSPESTGWQVFVADMFPETDCKELFKVHASFDPTLRLAVAPRKVVKIVRNLIRHGCGRLGLMIQDDTYERFIDANGDDVTDEVLSRFAEALGVSNRAMVDDPIERSLDDLVNHGENVLWVGGPGSGKSSKAYEGILARDPEAEILSVSMANESPENYALPMVRDGRIERELLEFFARPPKPGVNRYLLMHELRRAPEHTADMCLEILQERTIAGLPTNVHGILCTDNPSSIGGVAMDASMMDTAQADRFTVNIMVTPRSTGATSHLLRKYKSSENEQWAAIEQFVEWWDNLSSDEQDLFPIRALENAFLWWCEGQPLAEALPVYEGDRLALSFHELERRLADKPLVRIREVAKKVDHYVEVLTEQGPNAPEATEVYDAIDRADLVQLQEHKDLCKRIYPLLSQQAQLALVRKPGDLGTFWYDVLLK